MHSAVVYHDSAPEIGNGLSEALVGCAEEDDS
jgi:hypothetical protein